MTLVHITFSRALECFYKSIRFEQQMRSELAQKSKTKILQVRFNLEYNFSHATGSKRLKTLLHEHDNRKCQWGVSNNQSSSKDMQPYYQTLLQ